MSEAYYARKVLEAVHLLFFRRGRRPGAKEWELKKSLGAHYKEVLERLNAILESLDLKIQRVHEGGGGGEEGGLGGGVRYVVTLRGLLSPKEAKICGFRIDDLAGLAASIAYITSRQGKAPKREVVQLLSRKFGAWRAELKIDNYIKRGYLGEEDGLLFIDWRTRAEIDQKDLINLLVGMKT